MMAIDHHLNRPNDELAREIEALRERQQMTDPIAIALVGASVLLALGLASLALLKGFNAWLDYKRLELAAHGDVVAAPRGRADRDRRLEGAGAQARSDRRRD